MIQKDDILNELRAVTDPEIGIDIVSLGFIYDVSFSENYDHVKITMTLSSPACPVGELILANIEDVIKNKYKDLKVDIDLTFNPPWDPSKMPSEVKEKLGFIDFF